MAFEEVARRLAIGAEVLSRGVHFRVWAPTRKTVDVVLDEPDRGVVSLRRDDAGYFAGLVEKAAAGALYKFRLDGEEAYPDPVSRFQPDGPHGWSQIVDPKAFRWTDHHWGGVRIDGQIIYEMHIGTFTREGTWAAAIKQLLPLAEVGVTVLEVMPVAEFPGRFGWGYDGVMLFAPTRLYGQPDDFRRFVDKAHSLGMGVILDVVYNHFGPDGNFLAKFDPCYFSEEHKTDWGVGINFDGKDSHPVRELYLANIRYWVEEFHLDGFRLDATQDIHDSSADHILRAIAREARRSGAPREVIVVAENEPQHTKLVGPPDRGGFGLDALWNDDFHHTAMVALTGRHEAYYSDYRGTPQELISTVKYGFLFQGQHYLWQKACRGAASLDVRPTAFVAMLQNHDQVANSGLGLRVHALTDPGNHRAMTALLLLSPSTPMLFQGQEFSASSPFLFFADHKPEMARLVAEGRMEFLSQFDSLATPDLQLHLSNPTEPQTFERSKLDHAERERNFPTWRLHRDLIKLRREDPVFRSQKKGAVDGAVLTPHAFLLRFFGGEQGDRLLIINLGLDLPLSPAPDPLLAPPEDAAWTLIWSSEDADYGGTGTPPFKTDQDWKILGHSAIALASRKTARVT